MSLHPSIRVAALKSLAIRTFTLLLVAFSLFAVNAQAQSAVSDLAGLLFDRIAAPQAEPLIDQLINDGLRQQAIQSGAAGIYRQFGLEVVKSPEFKQAYVDAYLVVFNEEELRSLVDLASHPAFRVFVLKSQELHQVTNPAFITLMNKSRPELLRRLREAGFAQ